MRILSFTTKFNEHKRVLTNEFGVLNPVTGRFAGVAIKDFKPNKYVGIWDTGATGTVITSKVVKELGLIPISKTMIRSATELKEAFVYLLDLCLPNKFIIPGVEVTELPLYGADLLIGMDIIREGDFSVTNVGRKTVLSFRMPSVKVIDYLKENEVTLKQAKRVKQGRNELCLCGSGKKYKYCHGK